MKKFTITFLEWGEINKFKPGTEISFLYSLIEDKYLGTSDEDSLAKKNNIKIFIEGRKDASWGNKQSKDGKWYYDKEKFNLLKILYAYGKDYIITKLKDNNLQPTEELIISSETFPGKCIYDSNEIDGPNNVPIKIKVPD